MRGWGERGRSYNLMVVQFLFGAMEIMGLLDNTVNVINATELYILFVY